MRAARAPYYYLSYIFNIVPLISRIYCQVCIYIINAISWIYSYSLRIFNTFFVRNIFNTFGYILEWNLLNVAYIGKYIHLCHMYMCVPKWKEWLWKGVGSTGFRKKIFLLLLFFFPLPTLFIEFENLMVKKLCKKPIKHTFSYKPTEVPIL